MERLRLYPSKTRESTEKLQLIVKEANEMIEYQVNKSQ